jgi:2-polyprenyl-6-methoxyphenol hydroxylase-like FAD-dependent oxidoreductase
MLHQADEVAGMAESTVVADVASIAGVERTLRAAAANVGVETLYGVAPRRFEARAGVVTLQLTDGTTLRARHMIDASGGRLGVFDRGPERGSTVYLTGQLPPFDDAGYFRAAEPVAVSGRTGRAFESTLFGFVDARTAATVFVEYPSVPLAAADATTAHRLLTRHLDDSGVDPEGLYDAQFIRTPHLRSEYAVRGPVLGIGDTVRRVSPKTGAGVAHAIVDARAAAKALHSAAQAPRLAPIAFANFEYGVLARGAAGL